MGKIIQYLQITDDRKKQPLHRLKCMQSLKDKVGEHEYTVIEIPYSENRLEMVRNADMLRLDFAQKKPNMCYVDTDVFISTPLHDAIGELGSDYPYFAEYQCEVSGKRHADIYYFFVNGFCDYFKNYLPVSSLDKNGYSVKKNVLEGLNNYGIIPDESFYHEYETMSYAIDHKESEEIKRRLSFLEDYCQSVEKGVEQIALIMKMQRGLFGGSIRK